jgi:hypothetical protein
VNSANGVVVDPVRTWRWLVTLKRSLFLRDDAATNKRHESSKQLVVYGDDQNQVLERLRVAGVPIEEVDMIQQAGHLTERGRVDFGQFGGKIIQDGANSIATANPFGKG